MRPLAQRYGIIWYGGWQLLAIIQIFKRNM